MKSPALDAIVASPASDAPRLAWADQAGGERGEFVRIQCLLARQDLDRAERRQLAIRERELLQIHARTWSGLDGFAKPRFQRGFVDAIEVTLGNLAVHARDLLTRSPLLRTIRLIDMPGRIRSLNKWPPDYLWPETEVLLTQAFRDFPLGQIRVLDTEPAAEWFDSDGGNLHAMGDELVAWVAQTPALTALKSLTVRKGYVTVAITERLSGMTSLEELIVHNHHLRATDLLDLVRALPKLTRLAVCHGDEPLDPQELRAFLTAPEAASLRALDLRGHELSSNEIVWAASLPLEHLAFHSSRMSTNAFDALMANDTLRDLTLSGPLDETQLQKLSRASFAKDLRRLELSGMVLEASQLDRLLAFPALEYVCITQRRGERSAAALEAVIPEVAVRRAWGPR